MSHENGIGSYEFEWSVGEIGDIIECLAEHLSRDFAVIQWAKRRNMLDDPQAISAMASVVSGVERVIDDMSGKYGSWNKDAVTRDFLASVDNSTVRIITKIP